MRMGAWSMARVLRQRIEYYYYYCLCLNCVFVLLLLFKDSAEKCKGGPGYCTWGEILDFPEIS